MSFNKAELQAIRAMLSDDIGMLNFSIECDTTMRKYYYDLSDPANPDTAFNYGMAKCTSNRLKAHKKKLARKEKLLRKVKAEIEAIDRQPITLIERFFAAVRG